MNKRDAKELAAHVFQLEQELSRGIWSEKEEANKLIEFAETFQKQVNKFVELGDSA